MHQGSAEVLKNFQNPSEIFFLGLIIREKYSQWKMRLERNSGRFFGNCVRPTFSIPVLCQSGPKVSRCGTPKLVEVSIGRKKDQKPNLT